MLKYIDIYKKEGFKAAVKAAGWKVILLIIVFYLIRDVTIYILIPYLVAKGFFS
ncbi:MAG: hypothetical protein N4A46_13975 [Schleiferiaceae bacterium]|nr:hypothetical protein [Schleiferiaceae bacterium]